MVRQQWFHGDIDNYLSFLLRKTRFEARVATTGLVIVLVSLSVLGYFILKLVPEQGPSPYDHIITLTYLFFSIFFIVFFGLLWCWLIDGQAKLEQRIALISRFSKENPDYNHYSENHGAYEWTMFFSKSPTDITDSYVMMFHHQLFYLGVPMRDYPKEFMKIISPYLHKHFEKFNFEEKTRLVFWLIPVSHPNTKGKKVILEGFGFRVRTIEDAKLMIDVHFPMVTHLQDIFIALRANAEAQRGVKT